MDFNLGMLLLMAYGFTIKFLVFSSHIEIFNASLPFVVH